MYYLLPNLTEITNSMSIPMDNTMSFCEMIALETNHHALSQTPTVIISASPFTMRRENNE